MTMPAGLYGRRGVVATAALDPGALAELREELGDDLFRSLLRTFETSADARLRRLRELALDGAPADVINLVHLMKGLFAQYGALAAAAQAQRVLAAGGDSASGAIWDLIESGAAAVAEARAVLAACEVAGSG